MLECLKHHVEKSKQNPKDNNESCAFFRGKPNKFSAEKLILNTSKVSTKKIIPKIKAIKKYCFEPSFNSDSFMFNIIRTNKKRTAIAPT